MDTLMRICQIFGCEIGDVVEIARESNQISIAEYPIVESVEHLRVAENTPKSFKDK